MTSPVSSNHSSIPAIGSQRSDAKPKQMRGFANMSKEKLHRIASAGGTAAQRSKLAHRFTSATARKAGKVGGFRIAQDRDYMKELGRRGGLAKGVAMAKKRAAQSVLEGMDTATEWSS